MEIWGNDDIEKILVEFTKEYLEKIHNIPSSNPGIYGLLWILFREGGIKELGIFLTIAENMPIKSEDIVELLKGQISKATIYKKLKNYEEKRLLEKDQLGYWRLSPKLSALHTAAKIKKITEETPKSDKNE